MFENTVWEGLIIHLKISEADAYFVMRVTCGNTSIIGYYKSSQTCCCRAPTPSGYRCQCEWRYPPAIRRLFIVTTEPYARSKEREQRFGAVALKTSSVFCSATIWTYIHMLFIQNQPCSHGVISYSHRLRCQCFEKCCPVTAGVVCYEYSCYFVPVLIFPTSLVCIK